MEEGLEAYLSHTPVGKAAVALHRHLAESATKGQAVSLRQSVDFYYERLRNTKGQHYATAAKSAYALRIRIRVNQIRPHVPTQKSSDSGTEGGD